MSELEQLLHDLEHWITRYENRHGQEYILGEDLDELVARYQPKDPSQKSLIPDHGIG